MMRASVEEQSLGLGWNDQGVIWQEAAAWGPWSCRETVLNFKKTQLYLMRNTEENFGSVREYLTQRMELKAQNRGGPRL